MKKKLTYNSKPVKEFYELMDLYLMDHGTYYSIIDKPTEFKNILEFAAHVYNKYKDEYDFQKLNTRR